MEVLFSFSQDAKWELWLHIVPTSMEELGEWQRGGASPWDCPMHSAELQRCKVGQDCKLERVLDGGKRNQDSSYSSAFNCYVREV